jgi:hypothetical protein
MQKDYTASSLMAPKTTQNNAKTVEELYHELIQQYQKTDKLGNANMLRSNLCVVWILYSFNSFDCNLSAQHNS